jgi:hypothetical protein
MGDVFHGLFRRGKSPRHKDTKENLKAKWSIKQLLITTLITM